MPYLLAFQERLKRGTWCSMLVLKVEISAESTTLRNSSTICLFARTPAILGFASGLISLWRTQHLISVSYSMSWISARPRACIAKEWLHLLSLPVVQSGREFLLRIASTIVALTTEKTMYSHLRLPSIMTRMFISLPTASLTLTLDCKPSLRNSIKKTWRVTEESYFVWRFSSAELICWQLLPQKTWKMISKRG